MIYLQQVHTAVTQLRGDRALQMCAFRTTHQVRWTCSGGLASFYPLIRFPQCQSIESFTVRPSVADVGAGVVVAGVPGSVPCTHPRYEVLILFRGGNKMVPECPSFQLWLLTGTQSRRLPRIVGNVFDMPLQWARSRLIGGVSCTTS